MAISSLPLVANARPSRTAAFRVPSGIWIEGEPVAKAMCLSRSKTLYSCLGFFRTAGRFLPPSRGNAFGDSRLVPFHRLAGLPIL